MKLSQWMPKAAVLASFLSANLLCGLPAFCSDNSTSFGNDPEIQLISAGSDPIGFELEELGGGKVSLDSYIGKKSVLVVFWSFFCGPCREEVPLLDKIAKEFDPKELEMLAVNLDGKKLEKAIKKYVSDNNFSFRVLWEELEGSDYKTADAYGVSGTPTLVLIGRDGKISWSHVGKEDAGTIKANIEKSFSTHAAAPVENIGGDNVLTNYSNNPVKH